MFERREFAVLQETLAFFLGFSFYFIFLLPWRCTACLEAEKG